MIDSKLVILSSSPNLRRLGLNLSFVNFDQLPVRLYHLPFRINLVHYQPLEFAIPTFIDNR